jgi:hypothetical protein
MTIRTASCSCGQLQARVSGEPLRVSVCHCLACQQRSGNVFAAQARFAAEAFTVTGRSTEFTRVGDAGGRATFRFCAECGGTVYYTNEGSDATVVIPVGAFADPRFPGPTFSVYEERMHAWVKMPADIEHMD